MARSSESSSSKPTGNPNEYIETRTTEKESGGKIITNEVVEKVSYGLGILPADREVISRSRSERDKD